MTYVRNYATVGSHYRQHNIVLAVERGEVSWPSQTKVHGLLGTVKKQHAKIFRCRGVTDVECDMVKSR